MKIFINCANLRFGGGVTVGHNIIKSLNENSEVSSLAIVAPVNCGYEQFVSEKITIDFLKNYAYNPMFKPILNYFILPNFLKKHNVSCVLSLGNIAFPASGIPQILLIQNAYLTYPESVVWQRLSFKTKLYLKSMVSLMSRNLRYANHYFVQTFTMKNRLCQLFKISDNDVSILPNAVSYTSLADCEEVNYEDLLKNKKQIKLLFLSKFYPQKNFEVLFPLAKKIIENELLISFSITLDKNESKDTELFLEEIKNSGFQNVIQNIGNIEKADIAKTYAAHHGLFLPTLLESYSGTYIESIYFKRPIFTSDLDFAREVCKDAAFYFNPLDIDDIISVLQSAFMNPETIYEKIEAGKEHLIGSDDWNTISGNIVKQVKDLLSKR